jgi:hypothetical protein
VLGRGGLGDVRSGIGMGMMEIGRLTCDYSSIFLFEYNGMKLIRHHYDVVVFLLTPIVL